MNPCGCMTRKEREVRIRNAEAQLRLMQSHNDPRCAELAALIANIKEIHAQIIADGENCLHGVPEPELV